MKRISLVLFCLFLSALTTSGCGRPEKTISLSEARADFKTRLVRRQLAQGPVDPPPPGVFEVVSYESPVGKLAAYLTPDPKDGKKHPAIIWITGGDSNTIGDVWSEAPQENDQTAGAFRKAGIVMMFPSLRGGNDNPGVKEAFLGEVDDILAAREYLARQPFVDPDRIYLGGHSTGGTLVLLVSEMSDRFRAVFSFGPVADVSEHNPQHLPFNISDDREVELRSPGRWLHSIQSPTFVFEGTGGNIDSLNDMKRNSKNPKVQFYAVKGTDHFNVLAPVNRLIGEKILKDEGTVTNLSFTEAELRKPFEQ